MGQTCLPSTSAKAQPIVQDSNVITFEMPAGGVIVDAGEIDMLGKDTPPGFQKR